MNLTALLSRINKGRVHKNRFTPDNLLDSDSGLFIENYFIERLCNERKRTERTGRPFLLMILHLGDLFRSGKAKSLVQLLSDMLFSTTRETDYKGWYNDSSIGIIYTEMNGLDQKLVHRLYREMGSNLARTLGADSKRVEISVHVYPEENRTEYNEKFYPDFGKGPHNKPELFLKRLIDIMASVLVIVIFSPLFAVISAAIALTSEGPILFQQTRVGRFGEKFTFLKFRSMYINGDQKIHQDYIRDFIANKMKPSAGEITYKLTHDPRITAVGKFIRKTSLDELPQFFNVLRGHMSLIGPRPPLPYECDLYELWHWRRIEMKPGITGLWQVKGRSTTTFDDMVRLDLKYIRTWSLWLDLRILVQTPWIVLTCKGAY